MGTPPSIEILPEYFERFVKDINEELLEQNQLLMVAVAHHQFMYIHPFDNGNGRVGRLLTYALLIKLGFNVQAGRIINPSSVFYSDRDKYYAMLAQADSLQDKDVLAWSEYFLTGLKNQIEKIDYLTQREFTNSKILLPMLHMALSRQHITQDEFSVLKLIIQSERMCIKAADLSEVGIVGSQQKSYMMRKLRERNMVWPIKENGREYTIRFDNNYLLRSVIQILKNNGFIADSLSG